jgi:hypothetical protein
MSVETCSTTWFLFKISKGNWKVWDLVSDPLSDLENVLQLIFLSSEPISLQKFNSFLKYLRTVLVFNWNWYKPFDFKMKFQKLHNKKVLFWMTKYIIMFMAQGVLKTLFMILV